MANLAAIRKRIGSTKSTQQITRAMKMVAGARLRGAEDRLRSARPYADMMDNVVCNLAKHTDLKGWDLIDGREEVKKVEYVIITSDRGLCGGFNSSIIRYCDKLLKEIEGKYETVTLSFVGRKAYDYFKRRTWPIGKTWINLLKDFDFPLASRVGGELAEAYTNGEVDEIYIVYNEYVNAVTQNLVSKRLVPVEVPEAPGEGEEIENLFDYKFEPNKEEILKELLTRQVNFQLYRAFLESYAAEMGARMNAMDSATKNAGEMIERLTLKFNRTRQAAITTELMEIISGSEALKG